MSDTVFVPAEDRSLVAVGEDRVFWVPGEIRVIEVADMSLISSRQHTAGDTMRWTVTYEDWLDNAATIDQMDIESDSATCTVGDITVLGKEVFFLLSGGVANERALLTLTMADNLGNIKHDTISFTIVPA